MKDVIECGPILIEFWGLPLNNFASRCLVGPFIVCLGLCEDWKTKNLKLAKIPLQRVWH